MMVFLDRAIAGWHLAQRVRHLCGSDVVVASLPRDGVRVALEVAARVEDYRG